MIDFLFHDFIMLFQEKPLAQSFGILGMCISLFGFLQSDDKKTKVIVSVAMSVWVTHFLLMGLTTAAIAGVITVIRMILSIKYQKNIYIFSAIIGVLLLLGYCTYESVLNLIPIMTSMLGAFAFFFLEKVKFRLMIMCISLMWLTFHICMGSIGGMINEVLTQFILLTTIIRMLSRDGQIYHYKEVIHNILHKNKDVDMGRMIIIRDRNKVIKRDSYFKKLYKKIIK